LQIIGNGGLDRHSKALHFAHSYTQH
jgi:hypothetical protein